MKLYSTVTLKSFDEEAGVFVGIASTPKPDRVKDIVDSAGIKAAHLPVPLLWMHDHSKPAGTVESMTATDKGLEVVCRVLKDVSAEVKSYWEFVKAGAVSLSIGFRALEQAPLANGGIHYKQVELLELSLVTVPAHQDARVLSTKAVPQSTVITIKKGATQMTLAEQIAQFKARQAAATASMDQLIQKGLTLAGDDETAYKVAEAEVQEIDKHLARLIAAEARQAASAQPIAGIKSVQVEDNLPKGVAFSQFVKAMGLSKGIPDQALRIATDSGFSPRVVNVCKAAVSAGSTTSANFTSLIQRDTLVGEFIELLQPALIVSRLDRARKIPFDVKIPKMTTGATVGWKGEGKPLPLTSAQFGDIEIKRHSLGAIAAFTEELLRSSQPSADVQIQKEIIERISRACDVTFVDSANAGITGVKPAAVTNGATTAAASATTAIGARNDVKAAKKAMINANVDLSTGVWLMHPETALNLENMVNPTTGLKEFPLVNSSTGGFFESLPVILSSNVPGTTAAGFDLTLLIQDDIYVAEEGLIVDASNTVSLEMSDAPTGDAITPTSVSSVNMWQVGSVAIKVQRDITWVKRRPTAAYRISAAKYN